MVISPETDSIAEVVTAIAKKRSSVLKDLGNLENHIRGY